RRGPWPRRSRVGTPRTGPTAAASTSTRTPTPAPATSSRPTVLVLRVKVGDAGYRDPAGNPVPETMFYGKGKGLLVAGNKAMKVTWAKQGKSSELKLTAKHGHPVSVPVGHTWIELVPQSTGSVN